MSILIDIVRQETVRKKTLLQYHENTSPVMWNRRLGIKKTGLLELRPGAVRVVVPMPWSSI
jgi:hypothetical protein